MLLKLFSLFKVLVVELQGVKCIILLFFFGKHVKIALPFSSFLQRLQSDTISRRTTHYNTTPKNRI